MTPSSTKGPRSASTYRGARRNAARAERLLPRWRAESPYAIAANNRAKIGIRAQLADLARKAAAKALVGNSAGIPSVVTAESYLAFYRKIENPTRAVSRIIRELQSDLRKVARR